METIICEKGNWFCRINPDTKDHFDGNYLLRFEKYESDDGAFHDWPVTNIWKNVIDEIEYKVSDSKLPDGTMIPWMNKYPDLKPEVIKWLNETIGSFGERWGYYVPRFEGDENFRDFIGATTHKEVFFILKRDAMLFKLTWS